MNIFDKICAVLAFCFGVVLILLGIPGLFIGCSAHFTLSPVLGLLPAFIGWGIVRPIVVAWKSSKTAGTQQQAEQSIRSFTAAANRSGNYQDGLSE